MPRFIYDKGKIEGFKREIQEILGTFNTFFGGDDSADECVLQPMSANSHDTATISATESGRGWPTTLIFHRALIIFPDSNAPAIRRLIGTEFLSGELPSLIEVITACKDMDDTIRRLTRDDTQTFVDVIDRVRHTRFSQWDRH